MPHSSRWRGIGQAQRLKRVFGIDTSIEDPMVIEKILNHLQSGRGKTGE